MTLLGLVLGGLALGATVELPRGHTLASLRVRGMGGVCTALAESATCQVRAPATVGIRRPEDDNAWGADTTIQAMALPVYQQVFGGDDPVAPKPRVKMQVGANLSMNRWAAGGHIRQDGFAGPDGNYLASQFSTHLGLTGGTWAVGVAHMALLWDTPGGGTLGWGGAGSALWMPEDTGWRLGVAGTLPIRSGDVVQADWSATRQPGRVSVGAGYTFGQRNVARPKWPDRRFLNDDKSYLTVVTELELISGPGEAVDLDGAEGEGPSLQPRLGLEADVAKQLLRLRAGGYYEPPRFDNPLVPHVTAGAGVYLFTWLQGLRWRAAASLDWAPGEPSIGVGLETW